MTQSETLQELEEIIRDAHPLMAMTVSRVAFTPKNRYLECSKLIRERRAE